MLEEECSKRWVGAYEMLQGGQSMFVQNSVFVCSSIPAVNQQTAAAHRFISKQTSTVEVTLM